MSVIFVVLPAAMLMAGLALFAFRWAVRDGQFDDLDTAALRLLLDDDEDADDSPGARRR